MLAFNGTIGRLVVQRDKLDLDAQDSGEVLPEVGRVGIPIVTEDGLWCSVPTQP